MKQFKIAQINAFLVMLASFLVILGWVYHIELFKTYKATWVTMKFTTSVCFFLSGPILLLALSFRQGRRNLAQSLMPLLGFVILLLMLTLFASLFNNSYSGIESIFIQEANPVDSVKGGIPSLGSIAGFSLLSLCCFFYVLTPGKVPALNGLIGFFLSGLGLSAIAGYCFHASWLYFSFPGWSSAMSLYSALLFALLGTGFLSIRGER